MRYKADSLLGRVYDLQMVHNGAASMEHAIRTYGGRWQSYVPTRFIYSFFAFNSIYSIDWSESLSKELLVNFDNDDVREADMYHKYIDFCFQDKKFVSIYSEFFFKYIKSAFTTGEIIGEFKKIKVDRNANGGIYTQDFIDRFLIACEGCFDGRNFTKRNCLMMVKFIYKIRCNIFHGSKTLQDMHDPSQQKRIEIYTAIIIAVNQMVFSYLEYLANGESFSEWFPSLCQQLSVKKYE